MKKIFPIILFACNTIVGSSQVFKNPGIADKESFEIIDFIDNKIGFVTTTVDINLFDRNGKMGYKIDVNEGGLFRDEIEINSSDLTTITEKRTDLHSNNLVELFSNTGSNVIHFVNSEKKINKNFYDKDKNIYSRYAYFIAFRGFPFKVGTCVAFRTYMFEYGSALTMKLTNTAIKKVTVKAGTFDCYKLELEVVGWQSLFVSGKFYFYYAVEKPHIFVKYEEYDDGKWNANELLRIIK
jgi:hypothetical protein